MATLAVAAATSCSALTYPQVVDASKDHVGQQSPTPSYRSKPTSISVGEFRTLQAALDATPPGGTLTLPQGGTYSVTTPLVVPPRISVNGNGAVLKTPANSTTPRSDDAIMQLSSGDTVRNFVFDGNVHHQGGAWSQHRHAISTGAARNITIEQNTFKGLIGDGIYSSGTSSLTIDHDRFIGDHSNRNGISIISGSDVRIFANTFLSMARPDMPGAIDVEPNLQSQVIKGVSIHNNAINDPAKFGILIQDSSHASVSNVTLRSNTINCEPTVIRGGAGVLIAYAPATVTGNYINSCSGCHAIRWYYASGGSATGNHINGDGLGIMRYHSPNVTISGNTH